MFAVNKEKLLRKILASTENVRFGDMITLIEGFGFRLARISGSHHIFIHAELGMMNLQSMKGKAKPYQIRQFLRLIGEL